VRDRVDPLAAYVPNLLVDWLDREPNRRHRRLPGTFVFADISGFTALTERLAVRGRAGAEEMGDLLNEVFERLLTAAYDLGASLLKWGGDAVLLLFDGPEHLQRGVRAAWDMQQVMRATGQLKTSAGQVRLGMSIGVHTGELDVLLVGQRHRELVVVGPAATRTVLMEKVAQRGQVVLSTEAAAGLPFACTGAAVGDDGALLIRAPEATLAPNRRAKRSGVDLGVAMSPHLRDHLRAGSVDHEHRAVTVGFVELHGCDALLAKSGADALTSAVDDVISLVEDVAHDHQVTLLATDVSEDGCKVILTSGAPHSVGDGETRVLSAVRRVVDAHGLLALRGGVTCGAVFAGDYGPFYRRTYSVAGDVVNLAARLMSRAGPGDVIALPEVVERSRTSFATSALEPFLVKGKRQPVRAFSVHGLESRRDEEPLDAGGWDRNAFVGREAELSVLRAAAGAATEGAGQVVEVVAPPGMGKSRLVEELLGGTTARVLRADGDIYGSATPYQPMQRMLRRALELPPDVEPDRLVEVLRRLTTSVAPDLLPYLPLLGVVAGVELPSTPEVDVLDPQVRRDHAERVTSELLGRLLPQPVVMILNDTHFMDEATGRLVRRLAADVVDRPWLLVVTTRPDTPTVLDPGPHVQSLALPPLDETALARLVALALDGTPLARHRQEELVRRAVGNPLFLRHLLGAVAAGADLDALPDTVEAIIAVQIDRLPSAQKRWLRAASVLGMTVDLALLKGVLGAEHSDAVSAEGVADLVEPGHEPGTLEFAHHLIRLTAYEALPFRRRTELHARVADLLEDSGSRDVALLSLHSLHGERYDAAWRYGSAAGDAAAEVYAPAEARECYRRALTACPQLPAVPDVEVGEVCRRLARACMDLGEPAEAEKALRQGRGRLARDRSAYTRVVVQTAWHRHNQGRHAQALRWVGHGRKRLGTPVTPEEWSLSAELAEVAAIVHYDRGSYGAGRRWARLSVVEAGRGDDRNTLARSVGTAAVLDALSGQVVDEQTERLALDLYDEIGDVRGKGTAANKLAVAHYFAGRWDVAVRLYETATECSTRAGVEAHAAVSAGNLAEVLLQQGLQHEALGVLRPALEVWRASSASSFLSFGLMIAGRARLELGEVDEALSQLREARELADGMGEALEVLVIDGLVALALLSRDGPDAALAHVDVALARTRATSDTAAARAALTRVRGEALVALGRRAEGHEALRAALTAVRDEGAGDDLLLALEAVLRHGAREDLDALRTERAEIAQRLGVRRPAPS